MKKIQIEILKTHELDRNKLYLIEMNSDQFTLKEIEEFTRKLTILRIRGMFIIKRDDQQIKIHEVNDDQKHTD